MVLVAGLVCRVPPVLAAPLPRVLKVRVTGDRLRGLLGKGGLVFPSLWVYNGKRQLVFRFEGDHKDLVSALNRVWTAPRPIAGPPLIHWISPPQLQVIKRNPETPEWIFVETWASWNPACQQEKKTLLSFLAHHAVGPVELVLVEMGTLPASGHGTP